MRIEFTDSAAAKQAVSAKVISDSIGLQRQVHNVEPDLQSYRSWHYIGKTYMAPRAGLDTAETKKITGNLSLFLQAQLVGTHCFGPLDQATEEDWFQLMYEGFQVLLPEDGDRI